MEGKEVVAIEEAAAKIRAAAEVRESKSFKVMARTDARATHGLDEAPQGEGELRKVAETFKGVPLIANIVEDGKTPYLGAKALEAPGFRIALFPVSALLAVTARLEGVYETLLKGEGLPASEPRVTFQRYNELIGLGEMLADAAAIKGKTEA
ncbi:MAG: hypothetical protein H5U13_05655 [Parvibaculum sp.]|nr:hypothetical protein [Parvibaculum sp.]